ncbi:MAG TPA: hypothetical protein VMV69_07515 [Pirellulales bacterium]|nr:hypothetical protein [Pirellulales bacterium]
MSRESLPNDILKLIKPQQVRSYALAKGWRRVPGVNGDIALFDHPQGQWDQLIVPMDESFDDYSKRLREVVENLANFESRGVIEVLNDLITPDADILRYRVASSATGRGSVPLLDGIRLLEGAYKSILAAACSVVNPVVHHPRMSWVEAQQLLNACHLGQTERGSFTASISCPLRAVPQDQPPLSGNAPFARQAVSLLMRSLTRIVHAVEADDVRRVFEAEDTEPTISANLCDALLQMQPPDDDSLLAVSVSWATTLPPSQPIPNTVRIRREYFPIIEDIHKNLRPSKAPEASLFVGYVDTLNGQPGEDGRMRGDTTLAVMYEDDMRKARAELNADDYQTAIHAHSVAGAVRFKAVLHLGRRTHRFTDVSGFARVQ